MEKVKSKRGFASMTPERRSEVARKGGKAVKPENRAFFRDPVLASNAGKKGGKSVKKENRTFSVNSELASSAGRKGGKATKEKLGK